MCLLYSLRYRMHDQISGIYFSFRFLTFFRFRRRNLWAETRNLRMYILLLRYKRQHHLLLRCTLGEKWKKRKDTLRTWPPVPFAPINSTMIFHGNFPYTLRLAMDTVFVKLYIWLNWTPNFHDAAPVYMYVNIHVLCTRK